MIPMIQLPPRRVTANVDNSYEYRETSLKLPLTRYIASDARTRFPPDGYNQLSIGRRDAITIMLPLHASTHQQEPYTKLETIFESTRLHHTKKYTNEALSEDDLQSAVMGSRMKPT